MTIFSLRSMSKLAVVAALAGSAAGCTWSASGHVRTPMIVVEQPPPPPRPQATVAVRANFLWISGHQRWDGHRYVWQEGRYERERPGYAYVPGRWETRGRGHVWIEGEWRASGRGHGRGNGRGH